jgi:endonuclease/exonuclease/phosphatase family metal-dependent hydrolase
MLGNRRRSVSSSLTKRRMTSEAKADVEESLEAIAEYEADIMELQEALTTALNEVEAKWQRVADEQSELPLKPTKTNITVEQFGVAWLPYYQVDGGEVAAFALD